MVRPLHLVLSQMPDGEGPTELETSLRRFCDDWAGVEFLVVPHLYDLGDDAATFARLRQLEGDLLVAAPLFPRATYWLLQAHDVRGRFAAGDDAHDSSATVMNATDNLAAAPALRSIWCLDLRKRSREQLLSEVRAIVVEQQGDAPHDDRRIIDREQAAIIEAAQRRWYPVVDYSRCCTCLECLNFCLFDVYGLDAAGRLLVEQPDACRDGCPACARVCPSGAIMFPEHENPGIAGGEETPRGTISTGDLTQLLGTLDEQVLPPAARQVIVDRHAAAAKAAPPEEASLSLERLVDELDRADL